jgi:hypothetical protein
LRTRSPLLECLPDAVHLCKTKGCVPLWGITQKDKLERLLLSPNVVRTQD